MNSPAQGKIPENHPTGSRHPQTSFIHTSTIFIVLIITLAVCIVEFIVMTSLGYLSSLSNLTEATIVSSVLILLLAPSCYFFLLRPVSRHLNARHQTEAMLRQKRDDQLKDMLGASLDGYWVSDVQGRFLEVNDAFCSISGYSREELLNMYVNDLYAKENLEDTASNIKVLMEYGSVRFETQHIRKDGVLLDIEFSANYSNFNGERIFCFLRDITKRKHADAELHRSEERLRVALEGSGDTLWEMNFEADTVDLALRYHEMLGYEQDEIGNSLGEWRKLIHPDDLPSALLEMEKILAGKTDLFSHERRMRCKDGSWKWILKRGIVTCRDAKGSPLFMIGTNSNITERKVADEALRLQSEITANSAEGISLVRASDGVITYTNRNFDAMFGYAPGELSGQHIATVNAPSEKSPLETAAEIMQALEVNGLWQGEMVNIRKDGTVFWTSAKVSCLQHPQQGLLLLGYHWDITASKQAKEELLLASMVYQNSSEAIAVSDANNQIIAVNPAFERMTGYSLGEVLRKNPNFMSSGRHDKEFYRRMWREISETGYWQGEMWDKRKNGEVYAQSLTINAIKNKDGTTHRYVALFSDVTERKQSEELIWKQANFDSLTGLPNRRMFLDRLQVEVKKSDRTRLPLALLLIDLDHFKEVNDTLGHAVGDVLLKEAAFRICSCVRNSDTVARLGGDEFTVILSDVSDNVNIEDITQKIIDTLAESFDVGNEVVYVSASVGITLYPNDACNIEDLMKNADQAMYVAKKNGRNRSSYYTHTLQEAAQKRLRLTTDLRVALAENQFLVYFQPIVNLLTGRVYKAEALIRWQHPERGMVSPIDFIPLAEESGLIHEIGDWVFKESARWALNWSKQYEDDFQISVNKSPVQFRGEGSSYSNAWLDHLQEMGLSGKHIVVEITEGLLLNADTEVSDKLLVFRDAGIQVAIDDFGTGYSSLSYLKKFDIDYLKIDQSFVRNLCTDTDDLALCEAIIVMAHKLNLKVIAEGVETEEQRVLLANAGCDYAQGYLLSRPVPANEFEEYMKQRLKL